MPTHAVLLAIVSLEMTRPYIRHLRKHRAARHGGAQISDPYIHWIAQIFTKRPTCLEANGVDDPCTIHSTSLILVDVVPETAGTSSAKHEVVLDNSGVSIEEGMVEVEAAESRGAVHTVREIEVVSPIFESPA